MHTCEYAGPVEIGLESHGDLIGELKLELYFISLAEIDVNVSFAGQLVIDSGPEEKDPVL